MRKTCQTDQGTSKLIFRDALHAPDLSSNLISINRFDRAGFNMVFGNGQVQFRDPAGKRILSGTGKNGMYLLVHSKTHQG